MADLLDLVHRVAGRCRLVCFPGTSGTASAEGVMPAQALMDHLGLSCPLDPGFSITSFFTSLHVPVYPRALSVPWCHLAYCWVPLLPSAT